MGAQYSNKAPPPERRVIVSSLLESIASPLRLHFSISQSLFLGYPSHIQVNFFSSLDYISPFFYLSLTLGYHSHIPYFLCFSFSPFSHYLVSYLFLHPLLFSFFTYLSCFSSSSSLPFLFHCLCFPASLLLHLLHPFLLFLLAILSFFYYSLLPPPSPLISSLSSMQIHLVSIL